MLRLLFIFYSIKSLMRYELLYYAAFLLDNILSKTA